MISLDESNEEKVAKGDILRVCEGGMSSLGERNEENVAEGDFVVLSKGETASLSEGFRSISYCTE